MWTSKIRYQVKEFIILCMAGCKPQGSLNSCLSYAPQLPGAKFSSSFTLRSGRWLLLTFPLLLNNHWGWKHPLDHSLGSPYSYLEARNHWWLWHFLFTNMAGDIFISQLLSHVWLFVTLWTIACQAPLSMEFPRQEYWSLYFLLQGIFLTQGWNPRLLPWQANSLPLSYQGIPQYNSLEIR